MTPPLFLVGPAALDRDPVVVDGAEGRHAADVRRLRVGEAVAVGDGAGRLVRGVVSEVTRGRIVVAAEERSVRSRPEPTFVVVQAMAKGGRDTDAVEAMTEVGVDEVVGWQASRCVAQWSQRTHERWSATARGAAKQAHRAWVPVVSAATTAEVARRVGAAALGVVLHEEAGQPLAALPLPERGEIVVVVGPEGGLTDEEVEALSQAGARVCRLGATVLRTSTAGVAALSVLSAVSRWR